MLRKLLRKPSMGALVVAGCCLLVFLVAYYSPVSYAGADPQPTLLVSQAILERGTIRLDAYRIPENVSLDNWLRQARNGHYYYYWPLGPSVFSLPAVWIAGQAGLDMQVLAENHHMQNLLSAALCSLVFLALYAICRCTLSPAASLVITVISVLGSSLISTMATALWNIDFAVLLVSLALWLLCRLESGQEWAGTPYALGGLLFCAYFCRPSTATFILVALAYLFIRHRRILFRTGIVALALLAGFALFSWVEYGQITPQYYSLERFQRFAIPVWLVFYGHLLSPSRGLLLYNPWFAWVVGWAAVLFRRIRTNPLLWLSVAWLGLHVVVVSRSAKWWGGASFGPRLLAEVIPGCVVLTMVVWQEVSLRSGPRLQRIAATGYVLFGLVGMLINSGQGLYNLDTARWYGTMPPNVDTDPEALLDWRFPQFLASDRLLCARNEDYMRRGLEGLEPYVWGSSVHYAGSKAPAIWIGWSNPEKAFRWSECASAKILIRLGAVDPDGQYTLEIRSGSLGVQPVTVLMNGSRLGDLVFSGSPGVPMPQEITFAGSRLNPFALNEIEFRIPKRARPEGGDLRPLGLAFVELRLRPVE